MAKVTYYEELVEDFKEATGIETESERFSQRSTTQHDVVLEESQEYDEAYRKGEMDAVAEELADMLVTIYLQADIMGIDIEQAYRAKMRYNIEKSDERNEDGKITDDAEVEKPNFSRFVISED